MGQFVTFTHDGQNPPTPRDIVNDLTLVEKIKHNLTFDVTDIVITQPEKDKKRFDVKAKVMISLPSASGMQLVGEISAQYDNLPATKPDDLADELRKLFVQGTALARAGTAFPRQ